MSCCFGKDAPRPAADEEGVPPPRDASIDEEDYEGELLQALEPEPEPEPVASPEPRHKQAARAFDIRDPSRAAQRRREPRVSDDASAPRCMLGSRCEQVAFGLTVAAELCAYCGVRTCGACRSTQIPLDRFCTQNNEIKSAKAGETTFKSVCDSCLEHAPAEVRRRLRGQALKDAAQKQQAALPEGAGESEVGLPAAFQLVVKSCAVREAPTRDSKSTAQLLEGDEVSVVERRRVAQPQQDEGTTTRPSVWLRTEQGWVPDRTQKGKLTLLPQSLVPLEASFAQVIDAKGVPLKATLDGHNSDSSSKTVAKAAEGERLEITNIVRTSSGTLRMEVWTESGVRGWVTSKTKSGKERLSKQTHGPSSRSSKQSTAAPAGGAAGAAGAVLESETHQRIREREEDERRAAAQAAAAEKEQLLANAEAKARLDARVEFEGGVETIASAKRAAARIKASTAVGEKLSEAKSMLIDNAQKLASMEDTTASMAAGAEDFASMAAKLNSKSKGGGRP